MSPAVDILLNSDALNVMAALMAVVTGCKPGTLPEVKAEHEPKMRITLFMTGPLGAVAMVLDPFTSTGTVH